MMEAALVADTGQPGPSVGLNPLPTSSSRPLRPKPPPPPTPKPAPNLSRSPSLPPPSSSKTPCFDPPPNLPTPLSPTPASPTSPVQQNDASLMAKICSTPESNFTFDPLTNETAALSLVDRLQQTDSIWRLNGLSREEVACILKEEQPGVFLVQCTEETAVTLSVRTPDLQGPAVLSLTVRQQGAFLHLDGSFLLFDNIMKLISFYFVSRDVLPLSLRLPQAITTATKREELEVIAAAGKDFWTSEQHQQSKKDCSGKEHSRIYLHLNSVIVFENPITRDKPEASTSKPEDTASQNVTSPPSLHNGQAPQKVNAEPKVQNKPHVEMKYKRPPPRPPSVTGGAGLLFAAPLQTAEKKDESKLDENDKKSVPMMSYPSRPPIARAPLRSSRKSSDRERVERMEDEKDGGEQCERIGPMESGCQQQREETGKDTSEDKQKSSLSAKKPSRPVPPPRRKPQSTESAACPNQAGAGGGGLGRSHPPAGRRPDVSLYSPQGGAALVTDPDSASTSSTEDEVETQEQSVVANSCLPIQEYQPLTGPPAGESRSPKAGVKRTPTTVILDRARHRLSSVLTGLISHDRRLTQRIVELARDPSSYFGNLVKEHRAFTLETMSKHSTSSELLQEIRQMMTQLKSYLLQSTELHGLMEPQHQYAHDKLESIAEAALCKSVLKPLREPIYQCLEKLHHDNGSLEKLSLNQSIVLGSTTTALGVTTSVPETSCMEKISIKLSNLHLEYSPQRKIEMLLKACKIIYDSMAVSSSGRAHGADDFLPVMMYVLARSNLSNLQLDVEYMMELMDPALTLGEGSYYLTTTYGALEHIKTFDQQRTSTRQLSREVQDSIHRWERRRTLNKETPNQASVRDFLTVCCPMMGENPRTLGVLPTTTVEQLSEQCASRFEQDISEQDSYILSVVIHDEQRSLGLTEVALSVKNSFQPGAYCFVYHPKDQPVTSPVHSGPKDPPPGPPPTSPTTVHSPSAPPSMPPSVRPPSVPPSKHSTTTAPPSSIPPISALRSSPASVPPIRPPNGPPPKSTTAGPPNTPPPLISPQRSASRPVSPPIRPPNLPPPTPSTPAKTPPPTGRAPSLPPRSSAPNMPPPVPSPLLIPPKMLPPNLEQIPVTISVQTPASPASHPQNMPPPVPGPASVSSDNTPENIISAQAITLPSVPLAVALLSDSPVMAEALPQTSPVTGSTLQECTSLEEVPGPDPTESDCSQGVHLQSTSKNQIPHLVQYI